MTIALPLAALRVSDVVAAVAVAALVFLAAVLASRGRNVDRLRKRLEPHMALDSPSESAASVRRGALVDELYRLAEKLFEAIRLSQPISAALARAGVSMRAGKFFCVMLAAGLLPALLLAVAGLPGFLVVLVLPCGALVPYLLLRQKAGQRQRAFDEQLPQLLMTMAASVRVGHSFRQAMQAVVKEGEDPASGEFGRLLLESDLGRPLDQAFADLAERLGSANFKYVVNAITVQREVGGSLADLFGMTAETVRQRHQFTSKVRALTAMGRMSAYVLVAVPFIAVGLMTMINSTYTAPLFTTSTGHLLIIAALAGIGIGALLLRKIVSFRLA